MSTSNTKIELVTEAIEALVLASVAALTPGITPLVQHANYQTVLNARAELSDALKELITPTLRVISQSHKIDIVGDVSRSVTRTVAESIPAAPYGGQGIDGMNLA